MGDRRRTGNGDQVCHGNSVRARAHLITVSRRRRCVCRRGGPGALRAT
ncbi:hypothetical protein ACFFX0_28680 [Citricoccus parietis]|uniref:Uncharacterized protein n=1 Tax=Citricoccus parietis TaxID=592307 RepID=A0ABV5G7M2_9MICC